jgi:serine/threonine protein kinase
LAETGSLDSFLTTELGRSRIKSFHRRVQIAIDVLTVLRFMHAGSDEIQTCFHRDIKSANVVIKRNLTAQLIDCGLAKFVHVYVKNPSSTGTKGTIGYICPEYNESGIPCEAGCDIFSFGVVMAELWTGRLGIRLFHPVSLCFTPIYPLRQNNWH